MIDYAIDGPLAIITLQNPPVNAFGCELRGALLAELERADADDTVRAIVITGNDKVFCGGADMRQFNTSKYWTVPRTIDIAERMDRSGKLLVAAIGGVALGGGFELALASHYRMAAPNARLALSEVRLGVFPGGGGTLRLPRLIGVAAALEMMLNGTQVGAEEALDAGIVDEVARGELRGAAIDYAQRLLAQGAQPRRAIEQWVDVETVRGALEQARANLPADAQRLRARLTMLEVVEAGFLLSPVEARMRIDRATRELMESDEARVLLAAFFAERAASKTKTSPAPVRQ